MKSFISNVLLLLALFSGHFLETGSDSADPCVTRSDPAKPHDEGEEQLSAEQYALLKTKSKVVVVCEWAAVPQSLAPLRRVLVIKKADHSYVMVVLVGAASVSKNVVITHGETHCKDAHISEICIYGETIELDDVLNQEHGHMYDTESCHFFFSLENFDIGVASTSKEQDQEESASSTEQQCKAAALHGRTAVCAEHAQYYAPLYDSPPTMEHLLSHPEFCDEAYIAKVLPKINLKHEEFDCTWNEDGQCSKESRGGDVHPLCGCPCRAQQCPCFKYQHAFLHTVVGRYLNHHRIHWWLWYGLSLGALRHGGMIPHDYDSDFAYLIENEADNERFKRAVGDIRAFLSDHSYFPGVVSSQGLEFSDRFRGQGGISWVVLQETYRLGPVHLDLFPCVTSQQNENFINCRFDNVTFERSELLPLTQCSWHGEAWPCAHHAPMVQQKLYSGDLRRHPALIHGTSIECLKQNMWPSLDVCDDHHCDPLPVSRQLDYIDGCVPTEQSRDLIQKDRIRANYAEMPIITLCQHDNTLCPISVLTKSFC